MGHLVCVCVCIHIYRSQSVYLFSLFYLYHSSGLQNSDGSNTPNVIFPEEHLQTFVDKFQGCCFAKDELISIFFCHSFKFINVF